MAESEKNPMMKAIAVSIFVLSAIPLIAIPVGFGLLFGLGIALVSFGIMSLVYAIVTVFIFNYASEYLD